MDPGSGDLGEIVYSGLPGNTVGMATMVDMSEASKQKSGSSVEASRLLTDYRVSSELSHLRSFNSNSSEK